MKLASFFCAMGQPPCQGKWPTGWQPVPSTEWGGALAVSNDAREMRLQTLGEMEPDAELGDDLVQDVVLQVEKHEEDVDVAFLVLRIT